MLDLEWLIWKNLERQAWYDKVKQYDLCLPTLGVYSVLQSTPDIQFARLSLLAGEFLPAALAELEQSGLIHVRRNACGHIVEITHVAPN